MGKKSNKKISLSELKKQVEQKNDPAKTIPPKRRGRSRERRDPSVASYDSRGSYSSEPPEMDVEEVFGALRSCRSEDDVVLSTTLFQSGVIPENLDWALKAFAAMQRKKNQKNQKK